MKNPNNLIGYTVKDYRLDDENNLKSLILKDSITGDLCEIHSEGFGMTYLKIVE